MHRTLIFYFNELPWNLINHRKKERNLIFFTGYIFGYIVHEGNKITLNLKHNTTRARNESLKQLSRTG